MCNTARRKRISICIAVWIAAFSIIEKDSSTTHAFTPQTYSRRQLQQHRQAHGSSSASCRIYRPLYDKNSNEDVDSEGLVGRFWSPQIDDPAMPLTEAGLVQIVAPTLQLFWLISLNSPYPSWAQPLYDYTFAAQGAFLAPTLIHGAGLACCWLLGCLAARAYEKPNFRVNDDGDYGRIVSSTIKAGAFACGILILSTQVDLYQEFGGYVQTGDSPETDLRIYRALVEVVNDIFFEFIVLLPWRLFRSNFD